MDLRELELTHQGNTHPWELARMQIVKKILTKTAKNESVFIDIGCGDAFLVSELCKSRPFNTFLGYDINYTQAQLKQLNAKFFEIPNLELGCSLNSFGDKVGKVTHVLLLDVIEHIEDDLGFLKDIKSVIPKNTEFLITVPAFQSLYTSHDTFLGHYRRYNRKQLISVLTESGYKVTACNYFFFTILFARLIRKLTERKKSEKIDVDGISNWDGGMVLTLFVKTFLLFDFRITELLNKLGIHFPGLSIYCICKPVVL
jgi:2-polyprenyl-3-methyl-5-hydroxy-6-metoxy-1,4-benzoquinol methylase